MHHQNKALNVTLTVIRIFVGLLFIFSGLIKANDPWGLAYKMGEFFEIWAKEGYMPSLMLWLDNFKLFFSITMITFEIVAGMALIVGYRFKLFAFLILLLTIFFTFLTGYALFSGKIKECGCFGDCIKLQANESFMKDLILLALIMILVFFRTRIKQAFSNNMATMVMIVSLLLTLFMQWYVLKHLPFKDCLAYRIGNNLYKESTPGPDYVPEVYESLLTYKNKQTGKTQDFTAENIPWQDTLTWEFVTTTNKLVKPAQHEPTIKDFILKDYDNQDWTQQFLNYPGNLFLLFIKDVDEANTSHIDRLRTLEADCKKANIPLIALSASPDIATNKFNQTHQLTLRFFTIDGTACKTAMRSNPGIMLLHNGTVTGKWSYADYPTLASLNLDPKDNAVPLFPSPVLTPATDSLSQ